MLFNSYTFIIFFAVVLFVHNLPLSWRTRKFNLLVASYLFYAAWNPPFVILLWISTVVDWYAAKGLHRARRRNVRIAWLLLSLCVNLGLLGFFKYAHFVWGSILMTLGVLDVQLPALTWEVVLPVGISFYTFQTLSYTLDIYRRKAEPWHAFLDYALYVTFFPQLVAGPIVRAVDFLPQTDTPRRTSANRLGWGLTLLILGLFEKIVVSDGLLAPMAERLYEATAVPDALSAWAGTLAFSGQIFCDFAGYSSCAIGIAMCLGFNIMDNFRFPYAAIGFSDFWRRWHISLSTWLRDYLYIPLGGNRKGPTRTTVNLMLTMLLGGLWHGAAWTFVVWGGLHGVYLMIERVIKRIAPAWSLWRKAPVRLLLGLVTYLGVLVTWVFFRARTFSQAFTILKAMVGFGTEPGTVCIRPIYAAAVFVVSGLILLVHWLMRDRSLEDVAEKTPWVLRALLLAGMVIAIVLFSGEDRAFIYFQF